MEDWFWMSAAAVAAYFVKGLCGFANTLVFSTLLSFTADNVSISPVELVLGLPSNCILAWRGRKRVQLKLVLPVVGLIFLGTLPGLFLLKNAEAGFVKILFGIVIVCMGAEMLLRREGADQKPMPKALLIGIGLAAGVLCGLYGIGALVAVYMGRVMKDTQTMKANLCAVFLLENLFRLVLYSITGILTVEVLKQAFFLLPAMAVGLLLGMCSVRKLNEKIVRTVVQVMLILSGAALILNNL